MLTAGHPQAEILGSCVCAACIVNNTARPKRLIYRYRQLFYLYVGILCVAAIGIFVLFPDKFSPASLDKREWGFEERPTTEQCYVQERTAILLALFLGTFGADQFYAHHWPLAIFKLFTGGGFGVWSLIDLVLWIVGGIYGTPGCPGGSPREWAY